MKYALVLIFVTFNVFFVGTSIAAPNTREKRSLLQEKCPEGSTNKQCLEYATRNSKNLDQCHQFFVNGDSIEWQTCGRVHCGANTMLVEEDRTKPYPDCCAHCEVIDKNKPAVGTSIAAPNTREKRSLLQEKCPEGSTNKQCLEYATRNSKNLDQCHQFFVNGDSIEWQTCGRVHCGANTRLVEEDRTKPYPDCCARCEVIDKNKPAMSSGIL